jgi:hypothetical protein
MVFVRSLNTPSAPNCRLFDFSRFINSIYESRKAKTTYNLETFGIEGLQIMLISTYTCKVNNLDIEG